MDDVLGFLAPFQLQSRAVLGDISPSSLYWRGSPSHINVSLMSDLYSSQTPEEQIIRQRSRRLSLQHSPTKRHSSKSNENDTSFLQITPAKDSKFAPLSRKRLLLSPTRTPSTPSRDVDAKAAKRLRLTPKPDVPLQSELHAFSTSQLVDVLDKLVNNHPELENELRNSLPSPDLVLLQEKLAELKRHIFRALPTVRFGTSRDAYCFRKAKLHLTEFKRCCLEQGKMLMLSQSWEYVVRYALSAWKYVHQLPNWDDKSHNAIKEQCFQGLAAQCMIALKRGHFDREKYKSLRKRLENASASSKAIEPCIHQINKILEEML